MPGPGNLGSGISSMIHSEYIRNAAATDQLIQFDNVLFMGVGQLARVVQKRNVLDKWRAGVT